MKKKTKLKLKKQVYYFLAGLILIVVLGIVGINFYNDYTYKQTTEYQLTSIGYTLEESNLLIDKLSSDNLNMFLNSEKNEDIIDLLNEKYFLEKNLEAYLENISEYDDLNDVIAVVNVHAINNWYEVEYASDTSLDELVLVNKFYALESDYEPVGLTNISLKYSYGESGDNKLIDYAYEKFINLWNAAYDEGYYLMVNSSYRSYEDQEEIHENRKQSLGERKADESVARAGHSEHQTGLVVDMTSTDSPSSETFSESDCYKWLKENAHLYGWVERYPEDKTYITGYSPESWHWRYVGVEAATIMYEEGITFDEYYAYYIES